MSANDRSRWFGLAVLSVGVAMIIVDATIVNVALPSIIREFDLALADAERINSIYSLVFAALLLPAAAQEGIVQAVDRSAGQVLPALAEQPGSEAVVVAVSDAFASAARTTGFVAVFFVSIGFLLSPGLPDIRYADRSSRAGSGGRNPPKGSA